MPNWVENKLVVSFNDVEDAEDFFRLAKTAEDKDDEENSLLMHFIPRPGIIYSEDIGPKEREIYGINNWYDWNTKNWGTKWHETINNVEINENIVSVEFLTAGDTSEELVAAINTNDEADAVLMYVESLNDFIGYTDGRWDYDQTALTDIITEFGGIEYEPSKNEKDQKYLEEWYESAVICMNEYFMQEIGHTMGHGQGIGG